MKAKYPTSHFAKILFKTFTITPIAAVLMASAQAADATWNTDAAENWATDGNWLPAAAPGATSDTTNTDTATFGTIITAARIVTVDANRNIFGISFAGNSSGYTLSGGNLLLTNGGLIQTSGAGSGHTDVISSAIAIQGDGGAATFTAGSSTSSRLLNIGAVTGVSAAVNTTTLTLNGTNMGANVVSGIIGDGAGGGNLAVVKSGAGTWIVSGANTFTGGVNIIQGNLNLGSSGALGTSGTISFGGGLLQCFDTTDYSSRFSTAANQIYRLNTNGLNVTLSTALTSSGGTLGKSGAGTLTLTAANTFDGLTTVGGGTLLLSGGNDRLSTTGNIKILTSNDFDGIDLGGNTQTTSGTVTLGRGALKNGTLIGNGAFNATAKANVSANLQGSAALTVNSDGNIVTLSGNNTFNGGITLTTGILKISSANALGSNAVSFGGGTLGSGGDYTLTNLMSASGSNNYRFSPFSNTLTVQSNLAGATNGLFKTEAGGVTLVGVNTYGGVTTVDRGTLTVTSLANGGTGSSIGNSSNVAANLLIGHVSQHTYLIYIGTAAASTDRLFTIDKVQAANKFAGIYNNAIDSANTLSFTNTGSIDFTGTAGTRAFKLDGTNTGDNTFAPQIEDNGANATSFTKSGGGKWIVTGANTYTGATLISDGTLLINGSTGAGATTVNSTGTLGGTGTIGGSVTINGTLAPGAGVGTLSTAATVLNSGATLAYELDGDVTTAGGGINDLTVVTGNLTLDGTLNVTGPNFASAAPGDTYRLFTYSGTLTNNTLDLGTMPTLPGGATFSIDTATTGQVNLVVSGGSGTYASWASDPSKGNIPGELATGDFDNDGLSNLVEYALGKDPRVSDQPPGTLVGKLVTFTKGPDAKLDPTISYIIEQSTTLTGWTEVITDNNPANATVSFLLSATPKDFARLKIVQN